MDVKIIIKSATQMVDDFSMDCELTWTIGNVKEKLEELYPSNPKKESQKLIYGGKLLPDHLSLKSVLNVTQERHILHLVCPFPTKVNTNSNDSKQAASQSFPVPPINPAFTSLNQPMLNHPSLSAMPGITVTSLSTADSFQQYLAMQQMYAQFMTQYLSQYNGGVPPVIPYAPAMPTPPVQTPQVPAAQQNITPNRPQRRAEDDDRDYLDYLHVISRAAILFALLFYYSSLNRILIVISMFLCISMFIKLNRQNQRRQLEIQREINERQNSQESHADVQTTEMEEPVTVEEEEEESTVAGNDETVSNTSAENITSDATLSQQTEGRSVLSIVTTTASLISAFFSSLIPSDPVPVNVN